MTPLPERSSYIRVLPRAASLDIILKNTHFPDDLLVDDAQCSLAWENGIPFLVFQFKSAAYDFSEPLIPAELKNSEPNWLRQKQIKIRLLLADNVLADQVLERTWSLSATESEELRKKMSE